MRKVVKSCVSLRLAAVSVAVAALGGTLVAAPLKLGPVSVRPHIDQTATYSDNIFIQNNNEIGAWSFTTIPGVDISAGQTELFQLEAGYNFGKTWFIDQPSQDFISHNAHAGIKSEMNRLKIGANVGYNFTTDANTLVGERVQGGSLNSGVNTFFKASEKIGINVSWTHQFADFTSDDLIDNTADVVGGSVGYAFDSLTSFNIYGNFTRNEVSRGSSFDGYSLGASVNRTFNSTFSGFLSMGYSENAMLNVFQQNSVFEGFNYTTTAPNQNSISQSSVGTKSQGINVGTGLTATTGKITSTASFNAFIGDSRYSTGADSSTQAFSAGVQNTFQATEKTKITLNGSRTINTSITDANNSYYNSTVQLGVEQQVIEKLTIGATGTYVNLDFDQLVPVSPGVNQQRTDDLFMAEVRITYNWTDWLRSYAAYFYQTNDSTISNLSFDENRFTVGIGASF